VLGEPAFASSARLLAAAFAGERTAERAPSVLETLAGTAAPASLAPAPAPIAEVRSPS
jgi:hypothetical protein